MCGTREGGTREGGTGVCGTRKWACVRWLGALCLRARGLRVQARPCCTGCVCQRQPMLPCAHSSPGTGRAVPSLSRHGLSTLPPGPCAGRCCPLQPAASAAVPAGAASRARLLLPGALHPTQFPPDHGQGLRAAPRSPSSTSPPPLHRIGGSKHHQRRQHPSKHHTALLPSADGAAQTRADPRVPWLVPVWMSLTPSLDRQGWTDAAATAEARKQPAAEQGRAG